MILQSSVQWMPRIWVVSLVMIQICYTLSLSGIYIRIFIIHIVRFQLLDVIPSKIYLNINNTLDLKCPGTGTPSSRLTKIFFV